MASSIQDDIINEAAAKLARSIDNQVMIGMLLDQGWSQSIVDPWKHNSEREIRNWCNLNCKGSWMQEGNIWVFENGYDQLLFALRWS